MTDPKARERAQQVALEIGKLFDGPKPFWASDVADIVLPVLLQVQAEGRLEERDLCIDDIQDALGQWGGPEREHYTQAMHRAIDCIQKRAQGLDMWGRSQAGAEGGK